ncbi:MAG: integration host factor subunit beta [Bacteroidota bacterium]|nr:integration host factor subunit beta [Bacteroidota bacterium]MDX5429905.1 integration host factor subunit beta [Bacteroidota bacterium]MDX5468679.1 integration host factor subunit beta [Bacteroidota bacterium]
MTKAEVINEIVNRTGIGKAEVQQTVETFFKVMKTSMVEGNNIYFRGFGSFVLKKRAKKIARNISKNTAMEIPAHFIPKFKPAKTFADKVKKSEATKKLL